MDAPSRPSPETSLTKDPPAHLAPVPISSRQLFGSHQAVEIEHAGQRYLLRITRENKLILTK